jgi:uncharacterized membrane-anchored protein YjiN (DUF445 family)
MELYNRINRKTIIMSKKLITDELIEQKMISYGFGETDSHDEEYVRKLILKHYDAELTDQWQQNCDYYIYEESTADGYSVFVATHDTNSVCVSEDIHYYDSELSGRLQDAIKDGGEIYVDDYYQDFIDDAIQELYVMLAERFHEQAIDELEDEGYKQNTVEAG